MLSSHNTFSAPASAPAWCSKLLAEVNAWVIQSEQSRNKSRRSRQLRARSSSGAAGGVVIAPGGSVSITHSTGSSGGTKDKDGKEAKDIASAAELDPEAEAETKQALFLANNPSFFEWSRPDLLPQTPPSGLPREDSGVSAASLATSPRSSSKSTTKDPKSRASITGSSQAAPVDEWAIPSDPTDLQMKLLSPDNFELLRSLFADDRLFFEFVWQWLHHVLSCSRGPVCWSVLPGYWPIAHAFVRRLVVRFFHLFSCTFCWLLLQINPQAFYWPTGVIQRTARLLLANSEMSDSLGFFVQPLLRTTSVHDLNRLNTTLDTVDEWFRLLGDEC